MKFEHLIKALQQEEIVDEMIITCSNEANLIHVTFLDSIYRGLTITGEDDVFNVEVFYGMDLTCDFNGVMQVINFCLDAKDYQDFYEKLYGLKGLINNEMPELITAFDEDGQNSTLVITDEVDSLEISYAYGEFYIYNNQLDDEEYYGYDGPFDKFDILDIVKEYFYEPEE